MNIYCVINPRVHNFIIILYYVNIACMTETKFVCDRVEQFLYDHVGNANQCSVDIIYFDISFRYM